MKEHGYMYLCILVFSPGTTLRNADVPCFNVASRGKREVADLLDRVHRVEKAISSAEAQAAAAQQAVNEEIIRAVSPPPLKPTKSPKCVHDSFSRLGTRSSSIAHNMAFPPCCPFKPLSGTLRMQGQEGKRAAAICPQPHSQRPGGRSP